MSVKGVYMSARHLITSFCICLVSLSPSARAQQQPAPATDNPPAPSKDEDIQELETPALLLQLEDAQDRIREIDRVMERLASYQYEIEQRQQSLAALLKR